MNAARGLGACVKGDPTALKHLHATLTLGWLAFAPVAVFTSLKDSIPLLVFISVYANVAGHFSAWQACRVEVRQEAQEDNT